MPEETNKDLEKIIRTLPQLKRIIDGVPLKKFKDNLHQDILTYKNEEGKSIKDLALEYGRNPDDLDKYINEVVNEKYSLLYSADQLLSTLENTVLGMGSKGNPLKKITLGIAGRTVLLPAYLAAYSAHKTVDELLGYWSGLYKRDVKSGLDYLAHELMWQAKAVSDLTGVSSILNKVSPDTLQSVSMPYRIRNAAIRDILGWAKTGKETSPGYKKEITYLFDKIKGLDQPVRDVKDYHSKVNDTYSTDHMPAKMLPAYATP